MRVMPPESRALGVLVVLTLAPALLVLTARILGFFAAAVVLGRYGVPWLFRLIASRGWAVTNRGGVLYVTRGAAPVVAPPPGQAP